MNTNAASLSPISLSYTAALRGFKPRQPGEAFSYALVNCQSPELLIALAASNPEGKFFGMIAENDVWMKAAAKANERQVTNVSFLNAKLSALPNPSPLPPLDYLICDEIRQPLTQAERAALFDLATQSLKAGGLFNYNYRSYNNADEALRFIVREFAPEMSVEQAADFLLELKKIGTLYLKSHADIAAKLDQAIAKNVPDEFFSLFDTGESRSATFETVVSLRGRGMYFAGAGNIRGNYVELSIPAEAQEIVVACRENPLCESIKDLAGMNEMRSDIWCKLPATMSSEPSELYGNFAYGIILNPEDVPASVEVYGKSVDISSPLYKKLVNLMTTQPATIGDFLQQAGNKEFKPNDVVGAVQILVALGIARPMRGAREASDISSVAQPRFSGSFNRYIDHVQVTETLAMASKIIGDVVSVSPRDALVMQALNRAGLANSVAALLPELERLAKDPASSSRITELAEPTSESAHQMITDTVSHSIVQWYAYGLLEAA
jgi:hypothetical protein